MVSWSPPLYYCVEPNNRKIFFFLNNTGPVNIWVNDFLYILLYCSALIYLKNAPQWGEIFLKEDIIIFRYVCKFILFTSNYCGVNIS